MKRILCFGDSNTWGFAPKDGYRFDENTRWTGLVQKALPQYKIIEEGLNGRTALWDDPIEGYKNGKEYLIPCLSSQSPLDLVILMLGTNDCKTVYGASAEVIGKGIEKLIRQIKSADPATKILLVSPIWLGEGVWEEGFDQEFNQNSVETSKKLKKVYEKIASDYGCDFLAASDYVKPSEADREHLSLESHRILSDVIYEKLKEERKSA